SRQQAAMAVGAASIAHLTVIIVLLVTTVAAASEDDTLTEHHIEWIFNYTTNSSAYNYSSIVAPQTFYQSESIIFEMRPNVSLIRTSNKTTYDSCSTKNASWGDDTFRYKPYNSWSDPVLVILEGTGLTYFFSTVDDGFQCRHGMAFQILVHPRPDPVPPPPYIEPRIIHQPPPPGTDDWKFLSPLPPVNIPSGESREKENGGVKFGVSMQVVASAILFAVS
ncbi:hypothetical protein Tsubulata_020528, partial [Turnera subulata]